MSINNSYQVNFSTVKQLIHKLSSETIKIQLRASLEDVKKEKKDLYNTDNYLITLRQLLNMARSYVDEWLDTQALSKRSSRHHEETNININRTQASGPERNNGQKRNHYRNKDNYRKRKHSSDDDLDDGYISYYIN